MSQLEATAGSAKSRPNFLIIMSDEHAPMFSGAYGHPLVQTPHLDQLAENGVLFENAYCNSPLCVPSRMSFMTGRYIHHIITEGGLQGTRLSAQEEFFLTDPLPPANKHVMVDAVKHFVSPDPVLTNWGEIDQVMGAELDLLLIGEERDASVVAGNICKKVNPLIKEGQWRS